MNVEVERVINAFAEEIYKLAKNVLEDDSVSKGGGNSLRGSSLVNNLGMPNVNITGDSVMIELLFDNYLYYLDKGRKPKSGKQPPTSALIDWARQRGIPTDNSTLYLISRAIWRDGQESRPIFAKLEEEIEKAFETEWAEKLFDAITQELTNYFN